MSAIVQWARKNQMLALLLAGAIVAIGIFCARTLPIDAVPDVTNVQVQVVTRAPALSASEVEAQITQPVERAMAGTPGLSMVRSISKLGISVVTLIFRDEVDVYFARAQVGERLVGVRHQIPSDLGQPELGPISTALGEIYMFELRPDQKGRSSEELRTIVEWQIAPALRKLKGVIEVVGFGGALKQYRVTLDPGRLSAHDISVEEVQKALERDNVMAGGGYLERAGEQVVLRGDARFKGIEDIANAAVRSDDQGNYVRIAQLGDVDTGPAQRQGAMTRDGRGEVVGASVLMLKGENSREVVTRVKQALEELKPRLPAGLTIDPYYDRAEFIDRVLHTVVKNLSEGAVLVVVCLLLTLGNLRAGLLVAGAIPFAMLVGIIGLSLIGYSGNVMSLGAIDFGIVVEGAVVVVEHLMTRLGPTGLRRRTAIAHAMEEVARPVVFGVIIVLLVFLPLSTLEDVEGKMFRPVVYSLCFMLVGALFYALVVIPALAVPLFARIPAPREPLLARAMHRMYVPVLNHALSHPKRTLGLTVIVTLALLGIASKMGAEFLPRISEGSFAIDTLRPPSVSLTQAIALSTEGEQTLLQTPEVRTVVSRIGRPEGSVDPAGPESSDVFVILKDRSQWRPGLTAEQLAVEMSQKLDERVPATLNAFSQPIEMRVNDLIAGVKSDLAVKVYGEDLGEITDVSEQVRKAIAQVSGAADFKSEIALGLPALRVTVDRAKLARLGIAPRAALDLLQMSRAGETVGVVREGEKVFDLSLRIGGEDVRDERQLGRLPLITRGGKLVPLSMVTDIAEESTVVQIGREQMRRRLLVQGNVRGRDMVGFVKEAQAKVAALELPRGVELEWGGQFQNFNRAKTRLGMLVPVSLLVIGVMLMMNFGRLSLTLVTLANLPFAVSGGAAALILRGLPFSIPAGVGFIALAGVSVMNGVVMAGHLVNPRPEEKIEDEVRRAALASLRAIASTALVAAIGFIPAAIATGTGSEVQRPLATVVIGGLITAMLLSLPALPAMLLLSSRWERVRARERAEREAPASAPASS